MSDYNQLTLSDPAPAFEFCPQNLASFEGWDSHENNVSEYRELVRDTRKEVVRVIAPNVTLYRRATKYFVLDELNHKLLYLVELKREVFRGQTTIRQLKVWRDTSPVTKNISEEVFFDHLLTSVDLVISDDPQTPAGKRFWQLRVGDAFARGLSVYLIDLNSGNKTRVLTKNDFDALAPSYYGWGREFCAKRLAIGKL